MTVQFTLQGETPSKKNSRINTHSGRSFPSKKFTQWHSTQKCELYSMLASQKIEKFENVENLRIALSFYHGDLKRRDSDNQCSSIMDLLVDCEIIKDDNWVIVREKLIKDFYDKNNARCEIRIETLGA